MIPTQIDGYLADTEKRTSAQSNADPAFHHWYRLRLGFSDHLVSSLLDGLGISEKTGCVLDPFCGSGTTLVECKKRGIQSFGIDANPSSYFASAVKTPWDLNCKRLHGLLDEIEVAAD